VIKKEKCICCNGSGKDAIFNTQENKWLRSSAECKYCTGEGVRVYSLTTNNADFLRTKVYFRSKLEF
jgi:DnaJ-class molecular chaperone